MGNKEFLTIAVTGTAASGKSSVCSRLSELGIDVISLDSVSREVVQPGSPALKEIISLFGQDVISDDGQLNRLFLRQCIIKNVEDKARLEAIMHPAILNRMEELMAAVNNRGDSAVVVEVPLLFELGMEGRFDKVVLVRVGREAQLSRLSERDGVSLDDAEGLISLQMPDEYKVAKSDVIIDNSGELSETIQQVDSFWEAVVKPLDTHRSMV